MSIPLVNQILQVGTQVPVADNSLNTQVDSESFTEQLSLAAEVQDSREKVQDHDDQALDSGDDTTSLSNEHSTDEQSSSAEIDETSEASGAEGTSESEDQEADEIELSEEAVVTSEEKTEEVEVDLENVVAIAAADATTEGEGENPEETLQETLQVQVESTEGEADSQLSEDAKTEAIDTTTETVESDEGLAEVVDFESTEAEGQSQQKVAEQAEAVNGASEGESSQASLAIDEDLVETANVDESAEEFELEELEVTKSEGKKEASKSSTIEPQIQPTESNLPTNETATSTSANTETSSSSTPQAVSALENVDNSRQAATNNSTPDAAATSGTDFDPSTGVDRARFVQRVSGAFRAAQQRDGEIRLRLSPPELGALRIEIAVKQGALTAKLETETSAARNLLLDNLPALRERLAEQEITIEKFDVDVRDESSNQSDQAESREKQSENKNTSDVTTSTNHSAAEIEEIETQAVTQTHTIVTDSSLDVMI